MKTSDAIALKKSLHLSQAQGGSVNAALIRVVMWQFKNVVLDTVMEQGFCEDKRDCRDDMPGT